MQKLSSKEFMQEIEATLGGYWLSDLANFCSILFHHFNDVSWVGFYLSDGKMLRLAQFMGKPACTEIGFHRGVCGTSFSQAKPLLVDNVNDFAGHIACDSLAQSEMVLPFYVQESLVGVLDLDSHSPARFKKEDLELVSQALQILSRKLAHAQPLFLNLKG